MVISNLPKSRFQIEFPSDANVNQKGLLLGQCVAMGMEYFEKMKIKKPSSTAA
jgi:hypothetical protein